MPLSQSLPPLLRLLIVPVRWGMFVELQCMLLVRRALHGNSCGLAVFAHLHSQRGADVSGEITMAEINELATPSAP